MANNAHLDGPPPVERMSASPRSLVDMPESLVVLTHDVDLLQTLRVVAHDHEISTVGAEGDLASHLLEDHAGVAVLDTAAVTSPIAQLTERLKSQFPDLVLVVAGNLSDQSVLAAQITRGTVYRFLHKPVSEQRVRLFVNAAWRQHGVEHAEIIEATASNLRRPVWVPPQPSKKNMLWVGVAAACMLAVGVVTWLVTRSSNDRSSASTTAGASQFPARSTNDSELESLLAQADAALRRGALTTPPGDNAADLYRQALKRKTDDPRAAVGLERVMDRLLTAAEKALLDDRPDEAARLTDIARGLQPDHVRVAFLTTQIGNLRERLLLTQARQAAAKGKFEEAINVLDRASLTGGGSSSQVSEARSELAKQKVDDRVTDYLKRGTDRLRAGALVEPAQNNARFFIESARAIAPNDPNVRQVQRQLADRVVSQARNAITAGNLDEADKWIDAAGDSGVTRDDITSLTRDVARARVSARADSVTKLAQSFNQRMTQGRLVEPANDSAKFYLAQLTQTEATHPSTVQARQALSTRLLDEARGAVSRQDFAAARRWMSEARDAGADESGTAALERSIASTQAASSQLNEIVVANTLQRTRYSAPEYPTTARERGTNGWVDMLFTVRTDGTVGDIAITAAEPGGIFEQAAMAAVRKWRYAPILRDGRPIEQRAKVRIRFAME